MRIVDVNEFYSPTGGGVRTYIDRKMGILSELGHELIVIAAGKEDAVEERPGGGRIHYVKTRDLPFDKNYGLFWDAAPVTRLLDEIEPDLVETSSPWRPAWIVGQWQGNAAKVFFMHNDNVAAYAPALVREAGTPRPDRARVCLVQPVHEPLPRQLRCGRDQRSGAGEAPARARRAD